MEIDETKWLGTQKESALPSGRALRTRTRRGKNNGTGETRCLSNAHGIIMAYQYTKCGFLSHEAIAHNTFGSSVAGSE
jgi:hypothetical protein